MTCDGLDLLLVSDDPGDRAAAAAHAVRCAACAARLRFEESLASRAAAWREAGEIPAAGYEERVLAAARAARSPAARGRADRPAAGSRFARRAARRPSGLRVGWAALAAAAAFGGAMLGLSFRGPAPGTATGGRGLIVADALEAAERAEQEHAAAIAQLVAAAEPVLARSSDPATAPRDAALLLAYRDRLRALDRTIGEIQGHLARNAGNPTARALLLAAYTEKTDVLRELLALGAGLERGTS
ncbi:MAG: hypothetical protein MUF27_14810 [Acidobacteria bacterium]|nr:hypothetical protein [Acidobacteriota bacterium]